MKPGQQIRCWYSCGYEDEWFDRLFPRASLSTVGLTQLFVQWMCIRVQLITKLGVVAWLIRVHLYFHSPFPFTAWSLISWTTVLDLIIIFSPYFALLGTKVCLFSATKIYLWRTETPTSCVCATDYDPALFTSLCLYAVTDVTTSL